MDQSEFVASVRADLAADIRALKLAELIRQAYAEDQREVRAPAPRRYGRSIDEVLDDRERAADMRSAK